MKLSSRITLVRKNLSKRGTIYLEPLRNTSRSFTYIMFAGNNVGEFIIRIGKNSSGLRRLRSKTVMEHLGKICVKLYISVDFTIVLI